MAVCFITGATGFVGGHLAAACVAKGWEVRALARATSDTSLLEQLQIPIVQGDLTDADALAKGVNGVDYVFHTAAKVGDWGSVDEYRAINVEGLRTLLDCCTQSPPKRFVHFSSLGVYEARDHYQTDESTPLPAEHIDGYTQTKVESEQLALSYHDKHNLPVVVLRPGFIYGPRDQTVLPKIIESLRKKHFRYLGSGKQALNTIYVENLVEAAFLAAEKQDVVGEVFNLTDGEAVSKRRFIQALVEGLDLPGPRPLSVPMWIAKPVARFLEGRARRLGHDEPPTLTQARLKFLGFNLDFSIEKARKTLGYQPVKNFDTAMKETIAWYQHNAV